MTANLKPPAFTATGEFDVKLGAPEVLAGPAGTAAIGSHHFDKTYRGGLQGPSQGLMLSAGQPQNGSAAYVAMETFIGTLHGRSGGFALAHSGQMHGGAEELRVSIAPGSGSGELTGIRGELQILREGKQHKYILNYQLD